jgi:hypothetical protein
MGLVPETGSDPMQFAARKPLAPDRRLLSSLDAAVRAANRRKRRRTTPEVGYTSNRSSSSYRSRRTTTRASPSRTKTTGGRRAPLYPLRIVKQ